MASVTKVMRQMEDRFPIGTSVSLYRRTSLAGADSRISGTALASATVAADGSLTFSGVPDDASGLVAVATVNSRQVLVGAGAGTVSWAGRH